MLDDPRLMSFGEHLDELRRRLIFAVIGVVALFILALVFGSQLLEVLAAPLFHQLRAANQAESMLATSPLEGFGAYLKVATVAAILASMPWILYQTWLFIAPGLYNHERRFVYFLMPLSMLLTGAGVLILYFIILPVSLKFLILFGAGLFDQHATVAPVPPGITIPSAPVLIADPPDPQVGQWWINQDLGQVRFRVADGRTMSIPLAGGGLVAQQYRVSEYTDLVFMLGLAFAIAFQVPLVLLLLAWAGFVRPQDLTRFRKHVVFGCVVGAALLPTQDPWSLILLSVMMYGLFEFGIVLMRLAPARRVAQGLTRSAAAAPAPPASVAPRSTDADQEA